MRDDEVYQLLDHTFEWNRMKAARNVYRHGERFPEAASVFFDPDVQRAECARLRTSLPQ